MLTSRQRAALILTRDRYRTFDDPMRPELGLAILADELLVRDEAERKLAEVPGTFIPRTTRIGAGETEAPEPVPGLRAKHVWREMPFSLAGHLLLLDQGKKRRPICLMLLGYPEEQCLRLVTALNTAWDQVVRIEAEAPTVTGYEMSTPYPKEDCKFHATETGLFCGKWYYNLMHPIHGADAVGLAAWLNEIVRRLTNADA